jgi:hypothetical protein
MNRMKREVINNTLNCRVEKWNMDYLSRFDFIEKSRYLNDVYKCAFRTKLERQRTKHCIEGAKAYFSSLRMEISFNELCFVKENLFSQDRSFIDGKDVKSDVYSELEIEQIAQRLKTLYNCYKKIEPKMRQCVSKLGIEAKCKANQLRVIKTIRIHMEFVDQFLWNDPHLYVIYLIRDPRGILYSKSRVDEVKSWNKSASELCELMKLNKRVTNQLDKKYPGRIMILKYEDVADNTIETMRTIYRFLELPWSETAYKLFKIKTFHKSKHAYSTMRSNSSATAHAWEKILTRDVMNRIDARCKILYQAYGYRSSASIVARKKHDS